MKYFKTASLSLSLLLGSSMAFASTHCDNLPDFIQGEVTLVNFGYAKDLIVDEQGNKIDGPLFATQITTREGEAYLLTRDDLMCFVVDEDDDIANIEQEIKYAFAHAGPNETRGVDVILSKSPDAKFHYISGTRATTSLPDYP